MRYLLFRKSKLIALASVVALSAFSSISLACPMCKDSLASTDVQQASALPAAFNNSIYLLLIAFLTVLGSVVAMVVKTIRDADKNRVRVELPVARTPRDPD